MTIPASNIVQINPGVIAAGGSGKALSGLYLTENSLMPAGTVLSFSSSAAVKAFFGPASAEYAQSLIYFQGYDNSFIKPGAMLFAPFNASNRAAFLTTGSLAGLSLTALQAFSGVLTITLDGVSHTSSSINLSGATSFSNAATLIAAGWVSGGPTVTWDAVNSTFVFTSTTTGAGSSVSFLSGSLAADINGTSAGGAYLSQGAVADTPASAMNNAVAQNQNWTTFQTMWEPDVTDKQNFFIWSNGQNQQYEYVCWDTDAQAIVPNSTECIGFLATQAEYNGGTIIGGDVAAATAEGTTLAALVQACASFLMGAIASIDFAQTNGRITLAFRTQSGLLPTVISPASAATLIANGYNYYGAYATPGNVQFEIFYPGQVPGEWDWIDPYVNQIYLNSQMQVALMTLLTNVGEIPYTPQGYGLIRSALADPIANFINFGGIKAGVTLSQAEIAEVNNAAGVNAASVIENLGYYLQISDPGATVRAARGTPIINLWYTDGGAVQQITMGSFDIQ